MTYKEKKELKRRVNEIFDLFNILDSGATIGGLKNDILKAINEVGNNISR